MGLITAKCPLFPSLGFCKPLKTHRVVFFVLFLQHIQTYQDYWCSVDLIFTFPFMLNLTTVLAAYLAPRVLFNKILCIYGSLLLCCSLVSFQTPLPAPHPHPHGFTLYACMQMSVCTNAGISFQALQTDDVKWHVNRLKSPSPQTPTLLDTGWERYDQQI